MTKQSRIDERHNKDLLKLPRFFNFCIRSYKMLKFVVSFLTTLLKPIKTWIQLTDTELWVNKLKTMEIISIAQIIALTSFNISIKQMFRSIMMSYILEGLSKTVWGLYLFLIIINFFFAFGFTLELFLLYSEF